MEGEMCQVDVSTGWTEL